MFTTTVMAASSRIRRHVSKLKSVLRRHRPHHHITTNHTKAGQIHSFMSHQLEAFWTFPSGLPSLIGLICCHVIGCLDVCSECIHQYCRNLSCVNRAVFRYNLLFFLSGGGKFNYQGTKRWLEDNLDHTGIVQQSHTNPAAFMRP